MAKGEVTNTFADAAGLWYAAVDAAEGCGEQEVYGCTMQTVRNRASKAIHAEIKARQGQEPPKVKVEYVGLYQRADNSWYALFREC